MKKCGDCIHADICKQVNGGWFSCENIAYCRGFKDRSKYVEVVRCKDCKHYHPMKPYPSYNGSVNYCCRSGYIKVSDNDFCSYGEKREEHQQDCTYNKNGHCIGQKLMPECDAKNCDRRK